MIKIAAMLPVYFKDKAGHLQLAVESIVSKNTPKVFRSFRKSLGPMPKAATPMEGSVK